MRVQLQAGSRVAVYELAPETQAPAEIEVEKVSCQ